MKKFIYLLVIAIWFYPFLYAADLSVLIDQLANQKADKDNTKSILDENELSTLIDQLGNWDKNKAKEASDKLAQIGKPAVSALLKTIEDGNNRQKRYATRALRNMGQNAEDAIPVLLRLLEDNDSQTREYAIESLGNMVNHRTTIIPFLVTISKKDSNRDVQTKAKDAIDKLKVSSTIKSTPSKSDVKEAISSKSNISKHNQEEQTLRTSPNCKNITVFDIPLNGSLQEVITVLEKRRIEISSGYSGKEFSRIDDLTELKKRLREVIDTMYNYLNVPIDRKNKAFDLLQNDHLNFFSYEYGGQKYLLKPRSLLQLLNEPYYPGYYRDPEAYLYPSFDSLPEVYNSQFVLELEELPAEMESQGIIKMLLFLGTYDQNEPRCFLIRMFLGSTKSRELSAILTDKYGEPKLCCSHSTPIGKYGEEVKLEGRAPYLPRHINWKHGYNEGDCDKSLRVNTNIVTSACYGFNRQAGPFLELTRGVIGPTGITIDPNFNLKRNA